MSARTTHEEEAGLAPGSPQDVRGTVSEQATDPRLLYLELMKRCLTHALWPEPPHELTKPRTAIKRVVYAAAMRALQVRNLTLARRPSLDRQAQAEGKDWSSLADTMISVQRLSNLQSCMESALSSGIPGDFIETGVWRGGAAIFMRAVLQAHGVRDRNVWAADSFAGHPTPEIGDYPADRGARLDTWSYQVATLEDVRANFKKYGLLDEQVRFLKGWFSETLEQAPIESLALIRLDAVSYGATMESLTALYHQLSPGGYVIVDDYGAASQARQAVDDFRHTNDIREPIQRVDWTEVYWQRQ